MAGRLRRDVIIDGDVVTVGRLTAARVHAYLRRVRQQFWAESMPSVTIADKRDAIARHAARAIASIGNGNPEIHEMWANLGDAYRHNGDTEGPSTLT